jgi:hypothetical protein
MAEARGTYRMGPPFTTVVVATNTGKRYRFVSASMLPRGWCFHGDARLIAEEKG